MAMAHPLDRPVWNALLEGQAGVAKGNALALRFRHDVNILGAAADRSDEAAAALAGLVVAGDILGTVEAEPPPAPPGLELIADRQLVQMMLKESTVDWGRADWRPLGDDDAADMHELATLTKPGPWRARSHLMGGFIGVREGVDGSGRLLAMAGERMNLRAWTELSGVCTHPDARGNGLATALMGVVAKRTVGRGAGLYLHTYADSPAIGLYERLGFRIRREVTFTTWRA